MLQRDLEREAAYLSPFLNVRDSPVKVIPILVGCVKVAWLGGIVALFLEPGKEVVNVLTALDEWSDPIRKVAISRGDSLFEVYVVTAILC